jgi:hypothetical protein
MSVVSLILLSHSTTTCFGRMDPSSGGLQNKNKKLKEVRLTSWGNEEICNYLPLNWGIPEMKHQHKVQTVSITWQNLVSNIKPCSLANTGNGSLKMEAAGSCEDLSTTNRHIPWDCTLQSPRSQPRIPHTTIYTAQVFLFFFLITCTKYCFD